MLRLQRRGKLHQPSYRLVVGEKRSELLGEQVEDLGWYNPHSKKLELNAERINYWMKVGAKPADTVHNLLVNAGIVKGKKISVHKQPKKKEGEAAAAPAAATQPAETKPAA